MKSFSVLTIDCDAHPEINKIRRSKFNILKDTFILTPKLQN
ncbi:hypothetical protein THER_1983 [Thermodesulfovibrio sp. N1]|nr:hypothetical protein THER_1983 [Thermodesulfovibrio sp. N1]